MTTTFSFVKKILKLFFYSCLLGLAGGSSFLFYLWHTLPDPSILATINPQTTRFIQNKCPQGDCPLEWTSLENMSPFIPKAVILGEDKRFYHHHGFDFENLKLALMANLVQQKIVWGGSSLTMQLAKNLYLKPKKTLTRKLREILLTIKLERHLTKQRLIEIYLNVAQFGPDIFGITQAARAYFDKEPSELGPLEASFLASILPNPERASDPQFEKRFIQTGGLIFNHMILSYLPPIESLPKNDITCPQQLSDPDKQKLDLIIAKLFSAKATEILNGKATLTKTDELLAVLTEDEKNFVEELLLLAQTHRSLFSISCHLADSADLSQLTFFSEEDPQTQTVKNHYVLKDAWPALQKLLDLAQDDQIPLYVYSAYRADGYQLYLFLTYLRKYDYCLNETLNYVALPQESEHGCLDVAAFDFGDGSQTSRFEHTPTYEWLLKKAPSLGFELSYPRNNVEGRAFEPWHWRLQLK